MQRNSQLSITAGTGLSGAGAALLMVFFFSPWLTACGFTLSGRDLAIGINLGYGMTTDAAYPGLIIIPLLGLAALGLCLFCINQPPEAVRRRSLYIVAAGITALLALAVVGMAFASEIEQTRGTLVTMNIEYGYLGSVIAAGLVLAGGLLNRRGSPAGIQVATSAHRPTRSGQWAAPPSRQDEPPISARTSLSIQSGPLVGRTVPVSSDDFLIGRSSVCDLSIPDTTVSREYARLVFAKGSWFIQDQGSPYGIVLNGETIRAARLSPGDRIEIGRTTLIFRG